MTSRIKTARIWALRLGFGPRDWDLKGRDGGEEIVAKALDGQRYPLPLCECMWVGGG